MEDSIVHAILTYLNVTQNDAYKTYLSSLEMLFLEGSTQCMQVEVLHDGRAANNTLYTSVSEEIA